MEMGSSVGIQIGNNLSDHSKIYQIRSYAFHRAKLYVRDERFRFQSDTSSQRCRVNGFVRYEPYRKNQVPP
jgi:hypothetical protein